MRLGLRVFFGFFLIAGLSAVLLLKVFLAEVKPSVSTDGRSFTAALRLARSTPPRDRIVWVTVGSASGIAAIASETALTNNTSTRSRDCGRA